MVQYGRDCHARTRTQDDNCLEQCPKGIRMVLNATYIMPIRRDHLPVDDDLPEYLSTLSSLVEVIVVDGSAPEVFAAHRRAWTSTIRHESPATLTANGKVGGVLTGVHLAHHDKLVIADEDVRYSRQALQGMVALLDAADVVRPQNYFEPAPWHAQWDTARSLLNRLVGGDWPGTLGVRRALLLQTGGYNGNVLFENLELVRTITAAGGREVAPLDLYVRRRPSSTRHFWSQRIRQAYDELARPFRFVVSLAILPLIIALARRGHWRILGWSIVATTICAEFGRRRAGGRTVFSSIASLLAPAWLMERAICTWLALGTRLVLGGVRYQDTRLRHAATPMRKLRRTYDPGVGQRSALYSQPMAEGVRA